MAEKPIFCCTHPRACSTAFERVFMTRQDILQCAHEPFGDAFYYGPERMSDRFKDDEAVRENSGFSGSTYKTIFDRIEHDGSEGKRPFIKDMIYYLVPPHGKPPMVAPSLATKKRGVGTESVVNGTVNGTVNGDNIEQNGMYPWSTPREQGNPSIVPKAMLQQFHWMFLIRDPHSSVPSYYRCTIPPLDKMTGFYKYDPSEAGYYELRLVFDYLRDIGTIGPHFAKGKQDGETSNGVPATDTDGKVGNEICVIDADDMLDYPDKYIEAVCKSVGIPYTPQMLDWVTEEDQKVAEEAFEKWKGWHEDALESEGLQARKVKKHTQPAKSEEQWDAEWKEKYGEKGAKLIRETVDASMDDYLYLKQFALKL